MGADETMFGGPRPTPRAGHANEVDTLMRSTAHTLMPQSVNKCSRQLDSCNSSSCAPGRTEAVRVISPRGRDLPMVPHSPA
jgi:hypothetical protein